MITEYGTALIAAGAAILGSAITGFAAVRAARDTKRLTEYKGKVRRYQAEVEAFKSLEVAYSQELASTSGRSAESIRREVRKRLREAGLRTPTDLSGRSRLESEKARLGEQP